MAYLLKKWFPVIVVGWVFYGALGQESKLSTETIQRFEDSYPEVQGVKTGIQFFSGVAKDQLAFSKVISAKGRLHFKLMVKRDLTEEDLLMLSNIKIALYDDDELAMQSVLGIEAGLQALFQNVSNQFTVGSYYSGILDITPLPQAKRLRKIELVR